MCVNMINMWAQFMCNYLWNYIEAFCISSVYSVVFKVFMVHGARWEEWIYWHPFETLCFLINKSKGPLQLGQTFLQCFNVSGHFATRCSYVNCKNNVWMHDWFTFTMLPFGSLFSLCLSETLQFAPTKKPKLVLNSCFQFCSVNHILS